LVNRVFYGALKNKIWDKKIHHGHYLIRTFRPFLNVNVNEYLSHFC